MIFFTITGRTTSMDKSILTIQGGYSLQPGNSTKLTDNFMRAF